MKKITSCRPNSMFPMILAIILYSIACANYSEQVNVDKFFQCLTNNSSPFHPVSKAIYTLNNTSFLSVLNARIKNRRFLTSATPKPLAIIAAEHISHIQATVICAVPYGLEIRIRSGGHDYEGLSYVSNNPFLVLDMFNFRAINIDIASETARVQAGATLGELYYRIAEKSKVHAFPAGVGPTLGTGGHFSGGGYGNLMRKYGLSVDNIIDAQIVTVDGSILDRKSMGDVFWAIRGGGGASFGVIVWWKIKLVRVPSIVTVFNVKMTLEQNATDVFNRWHHVADKLPTELFIRAKPEAVNGSREGRKTVQVSFVGQFLGKSGSLLPLMNERFPELRLQKDDCSEMSWIESVVYWADFPAGTPTDALLNRPTKANFFFKSKSDYVKKPIPKAGLESIWKLLIDIGENGWMQWNPYGGRMSEISESETPFPHRAGTILKIQQYVKWVEEGTEATSHYLNISRTLYEVMTPYVSTSPREAFLNYRDLDIGIASSSNNRTIIERSARVYGSKYFKGNLERLMRAKTSIDPSNFFKDEQSIPPGPLNPPWCLNGYMSHAISKTMKKTKVSKSLEVCTPKPMACEDLWYEEDTYIGHEHDLEIGMRQMLRDEKQVRDHSWKIKERQHVFGYTHKSIDVEIYGHDISKTLVAHQVSLEDVHEVCNKVKEEKNEDKQATMGKGQTGCMCVTAGACGDHLGHLGQLDEIRPIGEDTQEVKEGSQEVLTHVKMRKAMSWPN